MRLVWLWFGQVLEMFIGLGHRTRDDVPLGSPGPEINGLAAGAAKREVLLLPGSGLPADRTKIRAFWHGVRRNFSRAEG
jgi:hypothetical protein